MKWNTGTLTSKHDKIVRVKPPPHQETRLPSLTSHDGLFTNYAPHDGSATMASLPSSHIAPPPASSSTSPPSNRRTSRSAKSLKPPRRVCRVISSKLCRFQNQGQSSISQSRFSIQGWSNRSIPSSGGTQWRIGRELAAVAQGNRTSFGSEARTTANSTEEK